MSDQYDGQELEGYDKLDPQHPALKALRAERNLNKELRTELILSKAIQKYPNVGFTPEDFEGLTPDKYEARAERIATLALAAAAAAETASQSPEPEPAQPELSDAERAFARMSNPLAGVSPTTGAKKFTLAEAQALYKSNRAEFERLRAAGQIDLGVKMEDRGGSLVFHNG